MKGRRPLLDLHHLGLRQTGNESWARCLGAALFRLEGPGAYDVAVTDAAPPDQLALLPARSVVTLSGSSARRLAVELPRALRRLQSSAVLVQYTAPLSLVPAVVAVHDLSFEDPRARDWLPPATRLRYRATIRASARRAAHVLALSESTREGLLRHYGLDPDRVSVVPPAVDPALLDQLTRVPVDRSARPTVLVVGNVLPRKNLVVVARAVHLLRERGQDVGLRVVGTVPPTGRADVEVMQRLLGDNLELSGHVGEVELAQAYRSGWVLAFPSLFEGFGIPVLEAMAAGLPVMVSDRTSLPAVVGDAGVVVPAGDVEAWADSLGSVLADASQAEAMAARGRVRSATYSWDASAAQVRDLLAAAGKG